MPLSDLGREQVRGLADWLADVRCRAVVHSPLSRAVESAGLVAGMLADRPLFVEVDDDLREVDFGEIEGWTADEVRADRPEWFERWQRGGIDGFPGGESLDGFAARVAGAIDRAVARHPEGDLAVVAHRGVVKNALSHLVGLPRDVVRAWALDLGSATVVAAHPGRGFVLERYNIVG